MNFWALLKDEECRVKIESDLLTEKIVIKSELLAVITGLGGNARGLFAMGVL